MPTCRRALLAGALAVLPAVHATSSAAVHNACSHDVYVGIVPGAPAGGSAQTVPWQTLASGGWITDPFDSHPENVGVSIFMATDISDLNHVAMTQLEYDWDPAGSPPKTWFDISNINATANAPFEAGGFTLGIDEGCTDVLNTCTGASCKPGDAVCQAAYNFDTDDTKERACTDKVDIQMILCYYEYQSTTCPNS